MSAAPFPGYVNSNTPIFYEANGTIPIFSYGQGVIHETDGSNYPPVQWNKDTAGTDFVTMGIQPNLYYDPVQAAYISDKEVGVVNTLLNWDSLATGRLMLNGANKSAVPTASTIGAVIDADGAGKVTMDQCSISTLQVATVNGAPYVPGGEVTMLSSITNAFINTVQPYTGSGCLISTLTGYVDVNQANVNQIRAAVPDTGEIVLDVKAGGVTGTHEIVLNGQASTISVVAPTKITFRSPVVEATDGVTASTLTVSSLSADYMSSSGGLISSFLASYIDVSGLQVDVDISAAEVVANNVTARKPGGKVIAASGEFVDVVATKAIKGDTLEALTSLSLGATTQLLLATAEGAPGQVVQQSGGYPVWGTIPNVMGGRATLGATSPQTIALPSAMADTSYAVVLTDYLAAANHDIVPQTFTTTTFDVAFNTADEGHQFSWVAVGTYPA